MAQEHPRVGADRVDRHVSVRAFIETAPDAMILVDPDGRIVEANSRITALFGADRLIGRSVEELMPRRLVDVHRVHRERFGRNPRTRPMGADIDLVAMRADGSEFPIDISLGLLTIDGTQYVSAAIRDVTERREAERRAAVAGFVIRAATKAIFACDLDGRVTAWNTAAEHLTGVPEADALGRSIGASLRSDDGAEYDELVSRALAGEEIEQQRGVVVPADGSPTVAIAVSAAAMHDSHGRTIGVTGVLHDNSELVELQDYLMESHLQLREAQRLAQIGLWSWDPATADCQLSEELFHLLGVSPFEFDGRRDGLLALIPDEGRDAVRRAMDDALASGGKFSVETPVVRPDGHRLWVELSGGCVLDQRGETVGLRGICQDLTVRHDALEALTAADRLKDEFLSAVSHELRTPLTVIIGFSKLLLSQVADELRPHVEAVERNAEEMHTMIERMLDFSQVQSGRVRIEPVPSRVRDLIDDLLPLVEAAMADHDFVVDVDPDLCIEVDPKSFPRIIVNLLTNAAKFTSHGQRIVLAAEERAGRCLITVSDEGEGIPADDVDLVFERFYQVTGSGRPIHKGTGIGLSIVKSYTELMGGTVSVESEQGVGTTFSVEFPLATAP